MREAPGRIALLAFALVAATILVAPQAAAQAAVDIQPLPEAPSRHDIKDEEQVTFGWSVLNFNATHTYLVKVKPVTDGANAVVAPNATFFLPPGKTERVYVTLDVPTDLVGSRAYAVEFTLRSDDAGSAPITLTETVEVFSHNPRVLGFFKNPLPAPLDNEMGVFLLEIAFWIVIGLAAIFFGDRIVVRLTRKADADTTRVILTKIRRPVFLLVLFIGLQRSLRILPSNGFVDGVENILAAGIVLSGCYVAYKVLDAALYYYSKEIAPRTDTDVDDILVPALRKVGAVVFFIAGFILILDSFHVDLTVFVGGAAVASLVIAFAAQDTLSNFFSGIFLLVDRPFKEGDDIQTATNEICRVDRIGLRSTRLYHYRNHEVVVMPNNQLSSGRIVNLSMPDPIYRINVDVGVAYGTNIDAARKLLTEIMAEHPDVVKDETFPRQVVVVRLGESSVDLLAFCYVKHWRDRGRVASELITEFHDALAKAGIEIPFPQRTLWIRNGDGADLALPAGGPVKVNVSSRKEPPTGGSGS